MLSRRDKKLALNVLGNYAVKGAAMLLSLLTMPAYMTYFSSKALLGVWFTLLAVLNWVLLFDFGIGSGVRNKIIPLLKSSSNQGDLNRLMTSAYFSIDAIILILAVVSVPIIFSLNWESLLGLSADTVSPWVLSFTVYISLLGVLLRFSSVIVSHVLYAMQKAVLPNVLIVCSNGLLLLYLLIAPAQENLEVSIIALACVTAICNNLPGFIVSAFFYGKRRLNIDFSLRNFSLKCVKSLYSLGGILFYLQILIALVFSAKEIFITAFIGANQVVDYQIYYKLIGMVGGLFALALTPIWSAVAKAENEGDILWIERLYKRAKVIILVFSVGQLVLVPLIPFIIPFWLGENAISTSYSYSLLFCCYNALYMWVMLHYNLMCGLNRLKTLVVCLTIAAVLNIAFAIMLTSSCSKWIMIIVATTLSIIPCAIALPIDFKWYLKHFDALEKSKEYNVTSR